MLKDFIKYRTYLRKQSLSVNEQYMMELLYEYYNADYGYAFPSFQTLMNAFNTTSKNRVSKVIKDLEEKGFITVDRANKNNRYIINDLKSYL
ncbi:MAG: helix-turn-helix domain-containing protein, partial [Terrisporobacter othiniensis]|uniref:helix-turn-helix domain-containing protein n=1 Tax=Terrisporobacter othiniensis TaxID=1577792 RepID=UPI002A7551A1